MVNTAYTYKGYNFPLAQPCELCATPVLYGLSLCDDCGDKMKFWDEETGNYHMKDGEIIDTTKCTFGYDEEDGQKINSFINSFLHFLEASKSWSINKQMKENSLLSENREWMREVLQSNIDECTKQLDFGENTINDFLDSYSYLIPFKAEWEKGNLVRNDLIIHCAFCNNEIDNCKCGS